MRHRWTQVKQFSLNLKSKMSLQNDFISSYDDNMEG